MDFGKILIGLIGYGFTVFLLVGTYAAYRDIGRSKRGVRGIGTPAENVATVYCGVLVAFIVAVATRLTLGAI